MTCNEGGEKASHLEKCVRMWARIRVDWSRCLKVIGHDASCIGLVEVPAMKHHTLDIISP